MKASNQHQQPADHRQRARRRGASSIEYVLLLGLVALGGAAGVKAFGGNISDKVTAQAERVRTLEGGATDASGDPDLPDPGAPMAPLEEALALSTTLVEPGHLVHGGHTFFHAYEVWKGIVNGFKDTSLEQRWGANGRSPNDATAPKAARTALDAAVASLDPARDADLINKGKEIRGRVDKLAGEAQHGAPSDGGKTGFNKLSIWGDLGDLVGVETRLYPSVTKWREAVRQVEKDVTDYMGEVKDRNAKRAADDRVADFKKMIGDQKKDMEDKAKRLPTMKPDELQAELEKALAQAYLRDAFKHVTPGRPNAFDDWQKLNDAAKAQAAVKAKEIVAQNPYAAQRFLADYYAAGIKLYDEMLKYDPNAPKPKPGPMIGPRR